MCQVFFLFHIICIEAEWKIFFFVILGLILLSTDESLDVSVQSELINLVQKDLPSFVVTDSDDREMETDSPTELTGVLPSELVRPQTDLSGAMLSEILEPEHFKEPSLTSSNIKVYISNFSLNVFLILLNQKEYVNCDLNNLR